VVVGMYLVARSGWQLFLVCLVGILVARTVLVRLCRSTSGGARPGGGPLPGAR